MKIDKKKSAILRACVCVPCGPGLSTNLFLSHINVCMAFQWLSLHACFEQITKTKYQLIGRDETVCACVFMYVQWFNLRKWSMAFWWTQKKRYKTYSHFATMMMMWKHTNINRVEYGIQWIASFGEVCAHRIIKNYGIQFLFVQLCDFQYEIFFFFLICCCYICAWYFRELRACTPCILRLTNKSMWPTYKNETKKMLL